MSITSVRGKRNTPLSAFAVGWNMRLPFGTFGRMLRRAGFISHYARIGHQLYGALIEYSLTIAYTMSDGGRQIWTAVK